MARTNQIDLRRTTLRQHSHHPLDLMMTNPRENEPLREPAAHDAGQEGWMQRLERRGDMERTALPPDALRLREPECLFAEACLISRRELRRTRDQLRNVAQADLAEEWEHLMAEPVPTVRP